MARRLSSRDISVGKVRAYGLLQKRSCDWLQRPSFTFLELHLSRHHQKSQCSRKESVLFWRIRGETLAKRQTIPHLRNCSRVWRTYLLATRFLTCTARMLRLSELPGFCRRTPVFSYAMREGMLMKLEIPKVR